MSNAVSTYVRPTSSADPTFSTVPLDPFDVMGIVKRGWLVLALSLLLGLGGGLAMLASMPPSYKANVRLVLESSVNKYLQSNKVTDGPTLGDDSWSQLHIISSEAVVLPVIRKLDLTRDPEVGMGPAPGGDAGPLQRIKSALKGLAERAGIKAAPADASEIDERAVYKAMADRLFVVWESQPLVINVSFESKDPVKAAFLANEVADSYINSTVESKRASARIAAQALLDRLAELRTQAANAERQLLDYKIANNVLTTQQRTPLGEPVDPMASHIATARIAMLDARARWEGVQQNDGTDTWHSYIPDNAFVSRLREQYIDTEARALDMESRVGVHHAASRKLRQRLQELTNAINGERKRLASSYAVDYNFAKARYGELAAAASTGLTEESSNSKVAVRLRELESSAETLRSLYNSMLQRVSEDSRLDKQLVLPDARILARATPPTRTESSKKRIFVLAGSTALGLLFGTALLFGRSYPLGVFRTPQQVRTSLGLMPVVVPKVRSRPSNRTKHLCYHAIEAPYSRFSEGIRTIWMLISAAQRLRHVKVIGVISALAEEGKTTIATNLATQVAMHAGLRTLLIDADLHRQSLTRAIAPDAELGLKEALDEPERLADFVITQLPSGADVLPCPLPERLPNAAQLLGSKKLEELIRTARDTYDLIVIEAPPIATVTDFRMLYPSCDAFVFVVDWGRTSQRLVLQTMGEVHGLWERVLCVALNKADESALKSIEGYKGKGDHAYFA